MPRAVVGDVISISGMCPWCTVTTGPTAPSTNWRMFSLPCTTSRSGASWVVSIVASGANTAWKPSQSLVSMQRKYRALSCLICSIGAELLLGVHHGLQGFGQSSLRNCASMPPSQNSTDPQKNRGVGTRGGTR